MKTDKNLGASIQKHLVELGVETPVKKTNYSEEDKLSVIEQRFSDIMHVLGLDLQNDSLTDTPKRVAKMYVNEIFKGLDYDNFPKCTTVQNEFSYNEMVIVKDITSLSVCEHHFVTIDGLVKIAYIPKEKVLGLSKLNRIVQFFSQRPQVQERLILQIFYALSFILETDNVAVSMEAVHYCVKSRGVADVNSKTKTNKLGGVFMEQSAREEFLNS